MEISTSIVSATLLVTILCGWVRFCLEHHALTTPDCLVWCGWMFTLGRLTCSIKVLNLGIDYPVDSVTGATDSAEHLETVFIACYFYDIGLYWPKASIIIFYWWLIPRRFRRLKLALYLTTGFVAMAFLATFDLLRSLENQLDSIWNSITDFIVNWALNIITDLSLFCLPFFVLNSLKLHGIFSLGMITMLISTARFVAYIVTDYQLDAPSGDAWCTIEMSTAVIVVSLPGLKSLLVQSRSPGNTTDRSTNGYIQTSSRQPSGNRPFASWVRIEEATLDDELALISYGQNLSLAITI
ncbi:uncharacterized protein BKA55DRAFT_598048 [Fusarium redolens]|uniref:Rhodopsin domain-containing protein n=1 Tax=Fusarium redolens TaxID=48865 RepID=A0A9P9JVE5_FUSRE|nr:uncharacterized protein BKA55DRAFT_598048 [Fusarium redolens]KAH7233820.1 hypothetical protein BKA55DRAFT_598048 [Fusarium redolens]